MSEGEQGDPECALPVSHRLPREWTDRGSQLSGPQAPEPVLRDAFTQGLWRFLVRKLLYVWNTSRPDRRTRRVLLGERGVSLPLPRP